MNEFTWKLILDIWCRHTDYLLKNSPYGWYDLRDQFDKYMDLKKKKL